MQITGSISFVISFIGFYGVFEEITEYLKWFWWVISVNAFYKLILLTFYILIDSNNSYD